MASKTNTGLVAYAKAQVGNPYWYGTFGQLATGRCLSPRWRSTPANLRAADRRRHGLSTLASACMTAVA